MGLFSKLFGTSNDDDERESSSKEEDAAKQTSTETIESDKAQASSEADAATASPAAEAAPTTASSQQKAEATSTTLGKSAAAASRPLAPGTSIKLSDSIRRQREQTHPGVAPPSPAPAPLSSSTAARAASRGPTPIRAPGRQGATSISSRSPAAPTVRESRRPQAAEGVNLRTLQAFYVDLRQGPVTSRWKDAVTTAAKNVSAQLNTDKHAELAKSFDELAATVEAWPDTSAATSAEQRDQALARCANLLPKPEQPLLAEEQLVSCERLMLEQVLLRSSDATPLTMARLHEAGLLSFSSIAEAEGSALAERARIELKTANRIRAAVSDFLDCRSDELRGLVQEKPTRHLTRLANRLASLDRKYQAACDADDAETKRSARREREQEVVALKLTLAQLGKPDLANDIDRMSTAAKAESVRRWLAEGHL